MHAAEPDTQPVRRVGDVLAGLATMVLVAIALAGLALGGIWLLLELVDAVFGAFFGGRDLDG